RQLHVGWREQHADQPGAWARRSAAARCVERIQSDHFGRRRGIQPAGGGGCGKQERIESSARRTFGVQPEHGNRSKELFCGIAAASRVPEKRVWRELQRPSLYSTLVQRKESNLLLLRL